MPLLDLSAETLHEAAAAIRLCRTLSDVDAG